MYFTIFIVILIFSSSEISSFKSFGDYYVENEGYIPSEYKGDPVSYNVHLTRSQYNKLISGTFSFSRKVGPLGLNVFLEKSDGINLAYLKAPNLCMANYSLEPFRERFSGIIDEECCVEAGNYTLTNWTIEDHLRPTIKELYYGKFTFHLQWTENHENFIMEQDIVVIFKNRDNMRKLDENPDEVEHIHENSTRKMNRGHRGNHKGKK